MPQLLKKLILQAKQEGREALRQLVSALNGLAAMHIIKNEVGNTSVVDGLSSPSLPLPPSLPPSPSLPLSFYPPPPHLFLYSVVKP